MPSTRRHKSARHQLHVCMSQQVQTCLCIADSLFISTVATLLHSYSTVRKMSYSACILLMFSRWRVASPHILLQQARDKVRLHLPEWRPQTTGEYWNFFRPCGVEWLTVVHSGDIQEQYIKEWSARTWWPASYPVTVLWPVYTHYEWENASVSKQRKLVTPHGFSKCLHRQTIVQVL